MIQRNYQIAEFRCAIQTQQPSLTRVLDLLYPDCQVEMPFQPDVTYEIVRDQYGRFCFYQTEVKTGEKRYTVETIDDLYLSCEWHLTMEALKSSRMCMQFHAGVIEKDGKAAILPGDSGNGKTTLVIGCVRTGRMRYLSDEVALVDPKTLSIRSFPRVLVVKKPTTVVFPELKNKGQAEIVDPNGDISYHIQLSALQSDCLANVATLSVIVFPRYMPTEKTRLQPLGQTDAVATLIKHAYSLTNHVPEGLSGLTKCLHEAKAYRLEYRHYTEAVELLEGLLE